MSVCTADDGMKASTLLLVAVLASSLNLAGETLTLKTRLATFSIDATGAFTAISDNGRNYLAPGQPAPVLSVRVGGKLHAANRATWDATGNTLTLDYDGIGVTAVVAVRAKPTHVTFELTALRTTNQIELVLWGHIQSVLAIWLAKWSAWCAIPNLPWAFRRSTPRRWGVIRPTRATSKVMALRPTTAAGILACRTS